MTWHVWLESPRTFGNAWGTRYDEGSHMSLWGGGMAEGPYVVVVGGANMDIAGRPSAALVSHDSNPGTVRLSHGGVGRNIAHNLALLGVDTRLVTAFGNDTLAQGLIAGCVNAGIDVADSITVPDLATSTYLFVMDETGDMEVAINDMAIIDELTPAHLEGKLDLLNGAAVVLAETNLPAATLTWLASHITAPLFCDPISTAKAARLAGALGSIHTLKPNRLEAQALSGVMIHDEKSLLAACDALLATGMSRAFVSLGADGRLCADATHTVRLSTAPTHVVNTTGAGDAMMAAIIWAYLQDMTIEEAGRAGLAASSIAVESEQTVSPFMSEHLLQERL